MQVYGAFVNASVLATQQVMNFSGIFTYLIIYRYGIPVLIMERVMETPVVNVSSPLLETTVKSVRAHLTGIAMEKLVTVTLAIQVSLLSKLSCLV